MKSRQRDSKCSASSNFTTAAWQCLLNLTGSLPLSLSLSPRERAEKVKAKEADTAKRERQYRLKELFSYEEALERLEDEKKVTVRCSPPAQTLSNNNPHTQSLTMQPSLPPFAAQAGVREEVKEREAKILELKQELMKVQVDLDAKEKVQEIRTRALHTQKEELARLHEVIKELREYVARTHLLLLALPLIHTPPSPESFPTSVARWHSG